VAEITPEFKQRLQRAFEELEVGQTFTFRRTFTETDVANFCGVTGDFNPYHLDAAFAAESFFGRRIIPGLLTGSMMTHVGGLLGFLATEMQFEFLAPVYVGDTITCTVTVAGKNPDLRRVEGEAEYVNQDGVGVLWARFEGFPGNVRLAR
jgi:3-hydroxybutyryl-CoA dehydratase